MRGERGGHLRRGAPLGDLEGEGALSASHGAEQRQRRGAPHVNAGVPRPVGDACSAPPAAAAAPEASDASHVAVLDPSGMQGAFRSRVPSGSKSGERPSSLQQYQNQRSRFSQIRAHLIELEGAPSRAATVSDRCSCCHAQSQSPTITLNDHVYNIKYMIPPYGINQRKTGQVRSLHHPARGVRVQVSAAAHCTKTSMPHERATWAPWLPFTSSSGGAVAVTAQ